MRQASYIMSRVDVNVRIIPSKYDMTDCEIEELAETLDGMNINILGLSDKKILFCNNAQK